MTMTRTRWAITLLGCATVMGHAGPAAAIECKDGYQRVQGNLIATPYCQDANLAQIARQFGIKASAERIRENPNYKREVCRIAGRDIRVQEACASTQNEGRSGRF